MEEKKGEDKKSRETKKENKEEKIEERKENIKKWLENKENLMLLGILIFSFALLLYYFFLTKNQPLWWDEAEYMSIAKNFAFNIPYQIDPARPLLFPFFAFIFFKLGFQELAVKFFIVLIPAFLVVLFTYLLVKEMYDKKTALIASFITAVSWIHLFYAERIMTDAIGLLFGLVAFYCFWKGYVNEKSRVYIWLVGVFVALSFLTRLTGILYGVIIALFIFLTGHFKPLKNKNIWLIPVFFLLTIAPYLLYAYINFGSPLAFQQGYAGGTGGKPLTFDVIEFFLRFVYDYPEFGFFLLFLAGLTTLFPMFLSLDKILAKKEKLYFNDFFIFLSIIFTLFFFIYFLRQGENRWLIAMSIGIFTIASRGIILIYDFAKKNSGKSFAVAALILILFFGAYFQLKHADKTIKDKIDSYLPVKESGLWIKQNSNPQDIVLSLSEPQTTYYSERKVYRFQHFTEEQFESLVKEKKPKYMIVSIFENGHPDWSYNPPEKYQKLLKPANAWFADQEKRQAVLIIYEFVY